MIDWSDVRIFSEKNYDLIYDRVKLLMYLRWSQLILKNILSIMKMIDWSDIRISYKKSYDLTYDRVKLVAHLRWS